MGELGVVVVLAEAAEGFPDLLVEGSLIGLCETCIKVPIHFLISVFVDWPVPKSPLLFNIDLRTPKILLHPLHGPLLIIHIWIRGHVLVERELVEVLVFDQIQDEGG